MKIVVAVKNVFIITAHCANVYYITLKLKIPGLVVVLTMNGRRIMDNKKFMCRPCMEQLKAQGKVIKGSHIKDKHTCEICKRRKYGCVCEMTDGEENG